MMEKTESEQKVTSPLGEHLAAIRNARKLSLRRVEELSNKQVSNPYLNQIETGKILQPSPNVLYILAGIYNASYEKMMELAGYVNATPSTDARHGKLATLSELNLTEGEELELARYLQFIRAKETKKSRGTRAVKADDSSLEAEQFRTVSAAAQKLLDRGGAWGVFPTPVPDLMAAASLKVAPISAFDESAMLRYLRQAGESAGRFLRHAVDKVLGILDVHAATVHIDETVSKEKQTFLKFHETAHFELPHQRGIFRWIQDCNKNLSPEIAELFEREANTFARIVLFQDDTFGKMTIDEPFSITVPMRIGKKFGASVYASIREYVRRHPKACAVIVLEPTETVEVVGLIAKVRRTECSADFVERFGSLALPDFLTGTDDLMDFVPLGKRRMTSPRTFVLTDRNGQRHEFIGEGFKTPRNTFVLIHANATLKTVIPTKAIAAF